MDLKAVPITGTMQVGRGRESPLFLATVRDLGGRIDVLLSADDRNVGLRLDRESARRLAYRLLSEAQ